MFYFLNLFFIVFHTLLILFNLFGWIWKRTRKLNLLSLSATAFFWIVAGIWYGFGYCPLTDWHWQVRRELEYVDMPNSYITFLIDQLTGLELSPHLVNWGTGITFVIAFSLSIYMNVKGERTKRNN